MFSVPELGHDSIAKWTTAMAPPCNGMQLQLTKAALSNFIQFQADAHFSANVGVCSTNVLLFCYLDIVHILAGSTKAYALSGAQNRQAAEFVLKDLCERDTVNQS